MSDRKRKNHIERKYLKTEEAAALIGVATGTLHNWRSRSKGPRWIKIEGTSVRYDIDDIYDYMESHKTE